MKQFIGKHLLLTVLIFVLAVSIVVFAVPQVNKPVSNYIGEKFGPKADVITLSSIPEDHNHPSLPMSFSSKNVKYSEMMALTINNTRPDTVQNYQCSATNKCELYQSDSDANLAWSGEYNCAQSGFEIVLPYSYTKDEISSGYLKIESPNSLIPPYLMNIADAEKYYDAHGAGGFASPLDYSTLYRYDALDKIPNDYQIKHIAWYSPILPTGEYKISFKVKAQKSQWDGVRMYDWGSSPNPVSKNIKNRKCAKGGDKMGYEQLSCDLPLDCSNYKGAGIFYHMYFNAEKKIVFDLKPDKPSALADDQDKIKFNFEMKDSLGNSITTSNITVSSTGGTLSQYGDNFSQAITSTGATITTSTSDGFYLKSGDISKITVTAKTFIEDQEVTANYTVDFKTPSVQTTNSTPTSPVTDPSVSTVPVSPQTQSNQTTNSSQSTVPTELVTTSSNQVKTKDVIINKGNLDLSDPTKAVVKVDGVATTDYTITDDGNIKLNVDDGKKHEITVEDSSGNTITQNIEAPKKGVLAKIKDGFMFAINIIKNFFIRIF